MVRKVFAIVSLCIGLFILMLWAAASHGNIEFRPYMIEDWIMLGVIIIIFLPFIVYIVKRLKKAKI